MFPSSPTELRILNEKNGFAQTWSLQNITRKCKNCGVNIG